MQKLTLKQQDAQDRQSKRETKTPAQQLAELDLRLGVGIGAQKERARLQIQLSPLLPSTKEITPENSEEHPKKKYSKKSKS